MRVSASGLTDVGLQREHNEDSFVVLPEHDLFVVADGMGGHLAGDVASQMATQAIAEFFESSSTEDINWPFRFDPSLSEEENRLLTAIKLANRQIVELGMNSAAHHGMGTTVVAALFSRRRGRLHVAHVGDSRAYRIRGSDIEQITRDHSLLNDYLTAMPDLSEEQLNELPRNVITRALGMQEQVSIDIGQFDGVPGDVFLLCSDGLSGMLDDEEMAEIVSGSESLEVACQNLIATANEHGGEDNVTVVLIRVEEMDADGMRATLPLESGRQ